MYISKVLKYTDFCYFIIKQKFVTHRSMHNSEVDGIEVTLICNIQIENSNYNSAKNN